MSRLYLICFFSFIQVYNSFKYIFHPYSSLYTSIRFLLRPPAIAFTIRPFAYICCTIFASHFPLPLSHILDKIPLICITIRPFNLSIPVFLILHKLSFIQNPLFLIFPFTIFLEHYAFALFLAHHKLPPVKRSAILPIVLPIASGQPFMVQSYKLRPISVVILSFPVLFAEFPAALVLVPVGPVHRPEAAGLAAVPVAVVDFAQVRVPVA